MLKIRHVFVMLGILLFPAASSAQISIGIGLPHLSIGINLPVYPDLVRVPGYPVYYAPRLNANFFFYDSMYWVYQDDNWYASSWYNGPWGLVERDYVPLFVLRVPVRYYRQPPPYFRGWRSDAPPRWGDHWGRDWEQRRSGWDRWDRRAVPAPAPLPSYQRQYSGDRYPRHVEQQHELQQRNYRYQPRDQVVRQHYQERNMERERVQQRSPQRERQGAPDERGPRQQDIQRRQQDGVGTPRSQSPQRNGEDVRRPTSAAPQQGRPEAQERQRQQQRQQPELEQRRQQMQRSQEREERQRGGDNAREQERRQRQERDRDRNE